MSEGEIEVHGRQADGPKHGENVDETDALVASEPAAPLFIDFGDQGDWDAFVSRLNSGEPMSMTAINTVDSVPVELLVQIGPNVEAVS